MAETPAPDTLTPADARSRAAEVFVLGFPVVVMDAVKRSHPVAANRFQRLPADAGQLATGLQLDDSSVLQTSAMADLAAGPAALHLPDMRGRYFTLTLIDAAGEAFASLGPRTLKQNGGDLVLAGPNFRGELTSGVRALRAPSDVVWAVSRIAGLSDVDMPQVEALAARQHLIVLRRPEQPEAAERLVALEASDSPWAQQIASRAPEVFFHRLQLLLEGAPAAVRRRIGPALAAQLAAFGGPAEVERWDSELRHALTRGFADGLAAIIAAGADLQASGPDGWQTLGRPRGEPDGPLAHAASALVSLGAPMREDVLAFACSVDESGRPLVGEERYRIHFAAGALPPVEAGWRLSSRALGASQAFSAIGGRNGLAFNRDGSLELLIDAAPPDGGRTVNWLPAPNGPFELTMRLDWPTEPALTGAWRMAPVERLGSRFARRTTRTTSSVRLRAPARPRSLGPSLISWRTTT